MKRLLCLILIIFIALGICVSAAEPAMSSLSETNTSFANIIYNEEYGGIEINTSTPATLFIADYYENKLTSIRTIAIDPEYSSGSIYFLSPTEKCFLWGKKLGQLCPVFSMADHLPEPEVYDVSFDLNYPDAPSSPETQFIEEGCTAEKPEDPERDEYIFIGWSETASEDDLFDFDNEIVMSVVLYAVWIPANSGNFYSVTFNINDGSGGAYQVQQVPEGSCAIQPTDPEREFYYFEGWFADPECTILFDFEQKILCDTIIYASWGLLHREDDLTVGSASGGGTEFAITGIEMLENMVSVTINVNSACTLSVSFLDEDTEDVITTVSTKTPDYCEMVPVTIPVTEPLPSNYIITADLYDDGGNKLCVTYRCINYTTAYGEFALKSVDDYDEEKVVSFDDDKTNNFGVLNDSIIKINSSESVNTLTVQTNEITPADDEEDTTFETTYIFENADASLLSLNVGDKIYIVGTSYMFKIATIENDNGKVILTPSADVELKDFYDMLKVNMEIDPAESDDAVAQLQDINSDETLTFSIATPDIKWSPKEWLEISFELNVSGTIHVEIIYDTETFTKDFFSTTVSVSLDTEFKGAIDATISNEEAVEKASKDITTIALDILPIPTAVPGLTIKVKPSLPLELEAAGGASFKYNEKVTAGFTYNSTTGLQTFDKKGHTIEFKARGEIEASVGPKLTVGVEFLHGVLNASVNIHPGVKFNAEVSVDHMASTPGQLPDAEHGCTLCLTGELKWFVKSDAKLSYKIVEDVLEGNIFNIKIVDISGNFSKYNKFYVSILNGDGKIKFGWGDCPEKAYNVYFIIRDDDGREYSTGHNIIIMGGPIHIVDAKIPGNYYLPQGTYWAHGRLYDESVLEEFTVTGSRTVVIKSDFFTGTKLYHNGVLVKRLPYTISAGLNTIDGRDWHIYQTRAHYSDRFDPNGQISIEAYGYPIDENK